jgi:hypothetical protein
MGKVDSQQLVQFNVILPNSECPCYRTVLKGWLFKHLTKGIESSHLAFKLPVDKVNYNSYKPFCVHSENKTHLCRNLYCPYNQKALKV